MFRNPQTWFFVSDIISTEKKLENMCLLFLMIPIVCLTRLTWLIHTSFLPSKRNLNPKLLFLVSKWWWIVVWKIILKFLHAGDYFPLLQKSAQNHKFSSKNNYLPTRRDFKINFPDHFSPSFLGQKWYFWLQIPFWG